MKAVFVGPDDDGLGAALADRDVDVAYVQGVASRPALEEAGIHDADLLVLTDLGEATAVPIARDLNDDLRTVLYADGSIPEFLSAAEVLMVDPALLDADAVAGELVDDADPTAPS